MSLAVNLHWSADFLGDQTLHAGLLPLGSVRSHHRVTSCWVNWKLRFIDEVRWYAWVNDELDGHEIGWYPDEEIAKNALVKEVTKLLTH